MPSRLEQTLQMPGGRANLRVAGAPPAERSTVELAITKPDTAGTMRYLDPGKPDDPWSTATHWLRLPLADDASELVFELGGDVTVHLLPFSPYELLLRDGGGMRHLDRFTGIALRGISSASAPIAPPAPPPPAKEEPPPLVAEPIVPPLPPPREPRWPLLAAVAVLVLLLAGGLGWYFLLRTDTAGTAPPSADAGAPVTLDEARRVLAGDPPPAEALTRAQAHAAKGELEGAFLLYRYAAEKGDVTAAVALAAMYDPATYSAQTSPLPAPNPTEAARWYEPAAQAGQAEAQYRLGMLLKSGATPDEAGPEKGVVWLRKAADQGYAQAQEELKK